MTYPVKGFADDKELVGYCAIHCLTERALFSKEQINRMLYLAGYPEQEDQPDFSPMHDEMEHLVDKARNHMEAICAEPR